MNLFPVNKQVLTHLFPMHPFSTAWKHQKTLQFSHVFRGKRKGYIGNKWVKQLLVLKILQSYATLSNGAKL